MDVLHDSIMQGDNMNVEVQCASARRQSSDGGNRQKKPDIAYGKASITHMTDKERGRSAHLRRELHVVGLAKCFYLTKYISRINGLFTKMMTSKE